MGIKRRAHIIEDTKAARYPRHFVFFDTETDQLQMDSGESEHVLKLGVAVSWRWRGDYGGEKQDAIRFRTVDELWSFIYAKAYDKTTLILVAHNISFDFKVVRGFDVMKQNEWILKKLIVNGTTNIWEFRKDKKTILVLDDMNYFKLPLKRLGDDLGLEKVTMPEGDPDEETWFKYCERDVDIMVRAWTTWLAFLKDNDLGAFGKTLASQAFNAFRHRFMLEKIFIHNNDEVTALERDAYYGGRTEAFFIGKVPGERFYNLDVNSMYPSVMAEYEYPTKLIGLVKSPSLEWLREGLEKYAIIAKVKISTPENVYPHRYNNRLVFPTGDFISSLSTRELIHGLERGYIKEVLEASVYERHKIFAPYVEYFYGKRKEYKREGMLGFSYLCKILLNSLYGKFGQRNEVYEIIEQGSEYENGYIEEYDIDREKWVKYRVINGTVEEAVGFQEAYNSFPAIPAHITADARMLLWDYMQKIGKENVYYCDTDSIFTNQRGLDNIRDHIVEGRLGMLGCREEFTSLNIRGLKDYTAGDNTVIKGVRKDAEKINENTFRQIRFEGLKGSIQKKRINQMVTYYEMKVLRREYFKGDVQSDGRVIPFSLCSNQSSLM